ncbi:MAG: RNA-binding domain-containing protein [Cyanobacteriota bacterium]
MTGSDQERGAETMTREELEAFREGWDFEAKQAAGTDGKGALPKSLWETYSAMANTEGGVILLGAKERKNRSLDLIGIPEIDRVETDLWNQLQNPQKVSANVLTREAVQRVEVDGRGLLLLQIPKASRHQRPVHINGTLESGTFLRVHEGDRKAHPDHVRRMVADSIPDRDSEVVSGFTLADLDPESVRRFREFFAARRPDHPFLAQSDEAFLVSIRAARIERGAQGVLRPTLAGLVMLGRETSLVEHLPGWHVSYKELPSDPTDKRRWVDHLAPDGTWNANLFQFYLRVITKLYDGLKVPFALEEGQFRSSEGPVHEAVREALVNALVHADLLGNTGIRIIKQRSGFAFVNPGLLLITPQQLWLGGQSVPRNQTLLHLFTLLRLGEKEGSGGPTMLQAWREQHWRAPRIWDDVERSTTHLQLATESLLPDRSVAALVERFGDAFTRQDELGRTILVTAEAEGSTTHSRIRELSAAHPRDITAKLAELGRLRLLESEGKTRATVYRISGAALLPLFPAPTGSEANDGTLLPNDGTSAANDGTLPPNGGTSAANDGTSERTLPAVVLELQRSRKADPELVDQAILALCRDRFLTAQEIAGAIQRSLARVSNHYLPRLLESGRLEPRHASKHHPGQAYRTQEEDTP